MIASVVIIVLSVVLVAYWLRYTCLLLLSESEVHAEASLPLFSFPDVRAQLRFGLCDAKCQEALDRDYAVLTCLLNKATSSGLETRLLAWDYRLMRCWYACARTAFPAEGRRALKEMADVLAVLATKLREGTAQTT
jgi:hypothetical protein